MRAQHVLSVTSISTMSLERIQAYRKRLCGFANGFADGFANEKL